VDRPLRHLTLEDYIVAFMCPMGVELESVCFETEYSEDIIKAKVCAIVDETALQKFSGLSI